MIILTYHQVMPAFLNFLFPFGDHYHATDFNSSGFYSENRLSDDIKALHHSELGRSGKDFRMCYNLKSVEPSQDEGQWSICHTAVYHSFDVVAGKAVWIFIKGNLLIRRRMEDVTEATVALRPRSYSSRMESLSLALAVHLLIFDWCRENWRWYNNFLQEELRNTTEEATLVSFENAFRKDLSQEKSLADTSPRSSQTSLAEEKDSSFASLQQVQHLEDKANEALLVLEGNINILSKIKVHYEHLTTDDDFPDCLRTECARDISRFFDSIGSIIDDLAAQKSGTEMLLRSLADRKNLVSCKYSLLSA